jgi:hypothetical protein
VAQRRAPERDCTITVHARPRGQVLPPDERVAGSPDLTLPAEASRPPGLWPASDPDHTPKFEGDPRPARRAAAALPPASDRPRADGRGRSSLGSGDARAFDPGPRRLGSRGSLSGPDCCWFDCGLGPGHRRGPIDAGLDLTALAGGPPTPTTTRIHCHGDHGHPGQPPRWGAGRHHAAGPFVAPGRPHGPLRSPHASTPTRTSASPRPVRPRPAVGRGPRLRGPRFRADAAAGHAGHAGPAEYGRLAPVGRVLVDHTPGLAPAGGLPGGGPRRCPGVAAQRPTRRWADGMRALATGRGNVQVHETLHPALRPGRPPGLEMNAVPPDAGRSPGRGHLARHATSLTHLLPDPTVTPDQPSSRTLAEGPPAAGPTTAPRWFACDLAGIPGRSLGGSRDGLRPRIVDRLGPRPEAAAPTSRSGAKNRARAAGCQA